MSGKKRLLIAVLVFALCILIGVGVMKTLNTRVPDWLAPLLSVGAEVSDTAADVPRYAQSKQDLIETIESLEEDNDQLQARILSQRVLEEENQDLRAMLGGPAEIAGTWRLGTIISRPNRTPYDTVMLDIGSRHDVSVGDSAYAYQDVLIGEVVEVSKTSALVELASTPGVETAARVRTAGEENTELPITVVGAGNGSYFFTAPREVELEEGAIVTRADSASSVIGIITTIVLGEQDPLQRAYVTSPFTIQELNYLQVRIDEPGDE